MMQPHRQKPKWAGSPWSLAVVLLLLAWGLRLTRLQEVPPGWRDDELINIHALSGELLAGRFPLYFTGASGHEPLYHYLHAGIHAVLGFNVLSGHLLSVAFGTLTVALTYTLARRLFGRPAATIAALALTTSFWSLMYSRTAIRHISLPPLALTAFYLLWRSLTEASRASGLRSLVAAILLGLVVGVSLYTYPAARMLPVLIILFGIYLALFHRDRFGRHWRGLALALALVAVLAIPLGFAILQGSGEATVLGITADARLAELAVPLRELQSGNPRPLLANIWATLGMFHSTGDPEWLYNIPGRPVFNLLGGVLTWAGVALSLCRWRRPRCFLLILWLGTSLFTTFVSIPPASLSHTILAQPVVYIFPALALAEAKSQVSTLRASRRTLLLTICHLSVAIFLVTTTYRDLRDYFVVWPQRGLVRFLYRAAYRDAADYLNGNTSVTDLAISGNLQGPWDRLAMAVDTHRDGAAVRLFDAERALIYPAGVAPQLILPYDYPVGRLVQEAVADDTLPVAGSPGLFRLFRYTGQRHWWPARTPGWVSQTTGGSFGNGLSLVGWGWPEGTPEPGRAVPLLTGWTVSRPLDLPPIPIVANPPPPGAYAGRRLAGFAHLLSTEGLVLAGDDGLWVDPLTLGPGDRFFQIHSFALPSGAPPGPYQLDLGLYDPMTGDRWPIVAAEGELGPDRLLISVVSAEEAP